MQTTRVVQAGSAALVFGIEWVPLLGDASGAGGLARRQGASHQILSGTPAAALGFARQLSRRQRWWAAADLFARQHARGSVAGVIALAPDCWHVLAAHEGVALVRADRSYPDQALAEAALADLRLTHPDIEIIPCPPRQGDGLPVSALQAWLGWSPAAPAMQRVRRVPGKRSLLAVTAGGLLLGAGTAWQSGSGGGPAAASPDREQAWVDALHVTLARRPVHGTEGSRRLLEALYRQPARVADWQLRGLQCESPENGLSWQCVSDYRRAGRLADNRGLLAHAPAGWRVDFPSLDRARVQWSFDLPARVPDPDALPPAQRLARDWASTLQGILPAFSALHLAPAQPLEVAPPRDQHGQPLPGSGRLPRVGVRALSVQGPLHSAGLLAPVARAVSWQRARLQIMPGAQPGLRTSRVTLHLEGVVYEKLS